MSERLFRYLLNPFLDADTGGGAGGGMGNTNPNGGGNGDPNAGNKVTFTPEQQAELERILGERLSRAEKTATKVAREAYAKEQGFDNAAAMDTAIKAHKEAQEKNKTDLQKAQEAEATAKAQAQAASERAKTALIRAAFAEQAIAQNLASAEDAFRLADLSKVTVTDDGTVDGVKDAVEALVKAKPYLVKQGGGTSGGTGGNPPRGNDGNVDKSAEQGKQLAMQRNAQSGGGYDPWAQQGKMAHDPTQLAQAVAAAVAAALQGGKQ